MAPGEGTVVLVWRAPSPWPPPRPVEICSQHVNGSHVSITGDEAGRLRASLRGLNGQEQTRLFQPIRFAGGPHVALLLAWSESEIRLALNFSDLELDGGPDTPTRKIVGQNPPAGSRRLFPTLDPGKYLNRTERLFAEKVRDIDQSVVNASSYDLLQSSGLLRHLLIDGQSLVDQVNRRHRCKLTFMIIDPVPGLPGSPTHHWRNPDPTNIPGAKTVVVSLKQLLATPCLTVGGVVGAVKDVIKTCANVKGGIHSGDAESPTEQMIVDWDEAVKLLGEEPSLRALAGICTVVLRGLTPLVAALATSSSQGGNAT
jgi:hypothetical protein